jgi:hypothetical protein
MLSLPQVTLCCVDTRLPQMALDAMRHCMTQIAFGDAILFSRPGHGLRDLPAGLRIVELKHINSIEAYSHFLIKELGQYLATSHFLIVQWDGYVLHPDMWEDTFLDFDYIGAVWPQYKDTHRVGNGGFSLRSRRLQDALASPDIQADNPEDVCIARTYRSVLEQRWGIRFADEATAHRFAFERERQAPSSFGFHGLSNVATLLTEPQLRQFMRSAPNSLFGSVEARGFIKQLLRRGMKTLARDALERRRQTRAVDWSDLRLWFRLALSRT